MAFVTSRRMYIGHKHLRRVSEGNIIPTFTDTLTYHRTHAFAFSLCSVCSVSECIIQLNLSNLYEFCWRDKWPSPIAGTESGIHKHSKHPNRIRFHTRPGLATQSRRVISLIAMVKYLAWQHINAQCNCRRLAARGKYMNNFPNFHARFRDEKQFKGRVWR